MISFSAVVALGVAALLVVRSRSVRIFEALILVLFGFFLAATPFGHLVQEFLSGMFGLHGALPIAPTIPSVHPVGPTGGLVV